MSTKNNPSYVREPIYDFGTKIIKTNADIEYCVEYINQEKRQTRLLWVKKSGEYVRLKAKQDPQSQILDLV